MEKVHENSVLILVDIQNDFLPGGALAVPEGDQVIPIINQLQKKFKRIVVTQDFHPADHKSFAANHPGKQVGEFVQLHRLQQILWPVHCVQGTDGSDFHPDLDQENWEKVFQKGKNPEVDSYSGFFDNARQGDTGLGDYLKANGVDTVYITGLAQDYCVKYTSLDAVSLGFNTFLIKDATRAVNLSPEDGNEALGEMKKEGVRMITSVEIE